MLKSLLTSSADLQSDAVEPEVGQEPESDPAAVVPEVSKLPMTICIETLGGEATPLIKKGAGLPAMESVMFSTAEDNQVAVTVNLSWGENRKAVDNLPLGQFDLSNIPPAPKGTPQIEVIASVDPALILTVTARDHGTGRSEVLDSVDLSQIEIPESIQAELHEKIEPPESPRDSKFADFGDLFKDMFGGFRISRDVNQTVTISRQEARRGMEMQAENGAGRLIRYKIPKGTKHGTRLRFRGQGRKIDGDRGDLLITVNVE